MTSNSSPDARPSSPAPPPARRSLGTAIFVVVMVLACLVAIAATTLFLTGTFVTGALPTAPP